MGNTSALGLGGDLSNAQISDDLKLLGSAATPAEQKSAAFERLRCHFVGRIDSRQKLAAVQYVGSLRFDIWEPPPASASTLPAAVLADRIRGLVFGAALGDATGLATEFLSRSQVREFYGDGFEYMPVPKSMFPDTHRMMWAPGDWTDDTDQLVLLLQSLLQSRGAPDVPDFASRLLAWRQSGFPELGDTSAAGLGQHTKAVIESEHFVDRPREAAVEVWSRGKSASNGGVMRTAVTGVPQFWAPAAVAATTAAMCEATHPDPRCVASCVVVSACVSALLRGEDLRGEDSPDRGVEPIIAAALRLGKGELLRTSAAHGAASEKTAAEGAPAASLQGIEELVSELGAMCAPRQLADAELDEPRKIGYTYKTLSAGLWGLRRPSQERFETTIRELVEAGGDADTNGAVCGALVGCRLGFRQLPLEWVAQMPNSSWLEAHVKKLLFMMGLPAL